MLRVMNGFPVGGDGDWVLSEPALTTPQVRALAGGLHSATLENWIPELVAPDVRGGRGHRYDRYWSVRETVAVCTIRGLRLAGCPLKRIAGAKKRIEADWHDDWRDHVLVWDGADLFTIDRWGDLRSVWKRPDQLMMRQAVALPVAKWRKEAQRLGDAALREAQERRGGV